MRVNLSRLKGLVILDKDVICTSCCLTPFKSEYLIKTATMEGGVKAGNQREGKAAILHPCIMVHIFSVSEIQ